MGETLRYTYHICEKGNVVPARYAKDIPGYQNAFDYPMKPEPPEPWEEEFDKDFFYVGRCGREGVIEGKNGGMVFDEKGSQFGAIKAFIRKVEQEAYERGKKEEYERTGNIWLDWLKFRPWYNHVTSADLEILDLKLHQKP